MVGSSPLLVGSSPLVVGSSLLTVGSCADFSPLDIRFVELREDICRLKVRLCEAFSPIEIRLHKDILLHKALSNFEVHCWP